MVVPPRVKIVVALSSSYMSVLQNWLKFYEKLLCSSPSPANASTLLASPVLPPYSSSLYFICFDDESQTSLFDLGYACSYIPNKSSSSSSNPRKHKVWLIRIQVISTLLKEGHHVLITDSDALWLRNPFNDLDRYQHKPIDIIASRGPHPFEITRRLGSSLCMGFIYIKNTEGTKVLLHDLYKRMLDIKGSHVPDDQRDLNMMLYNNGLRYADKTIVNSNITSRGKLVYLGNHEINIVLLPQYSHRRLCKGVSTNVILQATIVHCMAPKSSDSKREEVTKHGLWLL